MRRGFGLLNCQRYPWSDASNLGFDAEALANVEEAEPFGFESVWFSDYHFVDDRQEPSPLLLLAAALARDGALVVCADLRAPPRPSPARRPSPSTSSTPQPSTAPSRGSSTARDRSTSSSQRTGSRSRRRRSRRQQTTSSTACST
jgi:hypothetical protein